MRHTTYDKQAVISDIAEQKLKPEQIAEKHQITIANVYTIKAAAKRDGVLNSRGYKTVEERLRDEEAVLDNGLRERIKDMRDMDLTTTEITDLLQKEGIAIVKDDVEKVMARGAAAYTGWRPGKSTGKSRG